MDFITDGTTLSYEDRPAVVAAGESDQAGSAWSSSTCTVSMQQQSYNEFRHTYQRNELAILCGARWRIAIQFDTKLDEWRIIDRSREIVA